MTLVELRKRLLLQEDINFLLTNRVPRHALTLFMGWFSKIRHPWVCRASMAVWRLFADLDLSDAKQQHFESLHDCFTRELKPGGIVQLSINPDDVAIDAEDGSDIYWNRADVAALVARWQGGPQDCFTRELKPGARSVDIDTQTLASPCDGIVGACGTVVAGQVLQAKGFAYRTDELFGRAERAAPFEGGSYVTLRLTSSMYHRFHAPHDGTVEHVSYLSGDTWNVNPIALKRVERLFCRNERAVIRLRLAGGAPLALVPVAAILVASIRLHFLNVLLHLRWPGPNEMPCQHAVRKGQELGWFEHGSTIIVFAPRGFALAPGIQSGTPIRMGQALMRLPDAAGAAGADFAAGKSSH